MGNMTEKIPGPQYILKILGFIIIVVGNRAIAITVNYLLQGDLLFLASKKCNNTFPSGYLNLDV